MNKWPLSHLRLVKLALVAAAVLIAAVSLWVSQQLTNDLREEELRKVQVWAEAMRALTEANDNTDLNLVLRVLGDNHNIPLIVADRHGNITTHRNLELSPSSPADSLSQLRAQLLSLQQEGHSLRMALTPDASIGIARGDYITVHYGQSLMLRRLATYPYVQLGVVALFVVVAIFALLSSKKAEQNKVWVGLSKETAHQLGTPISSLMAWTQVLRESYPTDPMLPEMAADVQRLERIAERFSKIGSAPTLQLEALQPVIESTACYLRRRSSSHVLLATHSAQPDLRLPLSPPLLEWVIEVICKNAIDAMQGQGRIDISTTLGSTRAFIDITDTGKGIARRDFSNVFRPGFTTKARGWGLGLSLARRIVSDYHHGRIYVLHSEIGVGTTFRIELPLAGG